MKEHKKRPDPARAEILELEDSLARTRVQIAQAYAGFNAVSDGDLIESYVYEIQALQARYSYLLRRRKAMEGSAPTGLTALPPVEPSEKPVLRVLPRPARPVA